MSTIHIDLWLYGPLAHYGGSDDNIVAHLDYELPEGSRMCDLLADLSLPTEERGITFINGDLSAMPGLQPDLDHALEDGDRVALFHLKSMWPFQYRHDAAMVPEMRAHVSGRGDKGIRSRFD
jgi:sulfur carrier protein ThiS